MSFIFPMARARTRASFFFPAAVLATVLSLFSMRPADAATYYVRTDGGTSQQCTGLADAAYPGSGTAQDCAWSHPYVALPPTNSEHHVAPRIAGGDTLIIGPGSYMMGYGAPDTSICYSTYTTDCHMQPIPSGPDPQHKTRVLGAGWDQGCPAAPQLWGAKGAYTVIDMTGSSNAEVGCLEVTDHSSCIVNHCSVDNCTGGPSQIDRCVSGDDYANNGLIASDAGNVLLHDVNIHGIGSEGVRSGRLTDWTVTNLRLWANGFAGWDGDIRNGNSSVDTSDYGTMQFSHLEIAWSGCGERYPGTEIFGCWDQNEGGYGDGLGTGPTGGTWIFEDSYIHHNVSDGLDLLYADGTGSVTYRRVKAEGNAGNQLKVAGPSLVENSVIIGSCAVPWSTFPPNNYEGPYDPSQFVGKYNMELSGNCRASGDAIAVGLTSGATSTLRQNTITGQGDCLVMYTRGDATSTVQMSDNVLFGNNNDWLNFATGGGPRLTCGIYGYQTTAQLVTDNNLLWAVRSDQCPAGSVCADPLLTGASLEAFSALPLPNSPLINGSDLSTSSLDNRSVERPQLGGFDLGAIEYRGVDSPDNLLFGNSFESPAGEQDTP